MSSPPTSELAPTGTLRAVINVGNPVLTNGSAQAPGGITVDLAHALGRRLGVPVSLTCVDAASRSLEALTAGRADVGFLAVDPVRERELAFTTPYVIIEGVYVGRSGSPIESGADVDRPGVRVGVKEGSAYDLYLSRHLTRAQVVRGRDGTLIFAERELEVAAGVRQPMSRYVAEHEGLRVLEPRFMDIPQAIAVAAGRGEAAVRFLDDAVGVLLADGFVARSLARAGQDPALVAPTSPDTRC